MRYALAKPGLIGGVTIPNRVVMASMTTRLATRDGFVTERLIEYYRARARGGVGLVTVEMASPERAGRHRFHELGIFDDRFAEGLSTLARAIKAEGSMAAIQLGHGGGHTSARISGEPPVAPSAIPHPLLEIEFETVVPEAMSLARIEDAIDAFARAARCAFTAGFDVVEIHAAHGYLISQFLCPAENLRTDAFGGTLENRARFGLDIIRRIKKLNPGKSVVFRFDSDDFFPGGLSEEESLRVGGWAAEAGADALHVSGGHYRSLPSAERMIPPMKYPGGCFVPFAERLKNTVDVPVIVVGRLGDPSVAADVVETGKADFIALGRPLLADPEWLSKSAAGQPVRRCVACNTCVNDMRRGDSLHCLVNPRAGRELEWQRQTGKKGRRIAVIGAGPSGLTYAIAMAGENAVTVFERNERAGGALRIAGHAPLFQEVTASQVSLDDYVDAMVASARQAGVHFRFNCDPFKENVDFSAFDDVVIATGARYYFGMGALVSWLLKSGLARRRPISWLATHAGIRNWFYYKARRPSGQAAAILSVGRRPTIIGDAFKAGKTMDAIDSAFRAAFGSPVAVHSREESV